MMKTDNSSLSETDLEEISKEVEGKSLYFGGLEVTYKKMNGGFANLSIIYRRLKRIFFDSYETKNRHRSDILEIQESLRFLMALRKSNQANDWIKAIIRYSLKLQNKLLARYQRTYGEFPFEIVYKDAHAPLIYWMKAKPGITKTEERESSAVEKESIEDLIVEFG